MYFLGLQSSQFKYLKTGMSSAMYGNIFKMCPAVVYSHRWNQSHAPQLGTQV